MSTYDLHKLANTPTIKEQIAKITGKFKRTLPLSDDQLIRNLQRSTIVNDYTLAYTIYVLL